MKTLIILAILIIPTYAFGLDVIIKEWSEHRVLIGGDLVPNQTIAERKIKNYMARKGYIVKQVIMRQAGSGVTPWIFDFRCLSNIDDFRGLSAKETQDRLKDRNDIKDTTLEP